MKKVFVVLGVLLVLAIVAIVAVGMFAKAKFAPHAEKVLVECRDGTYEAVYADAAKGFRESTTLEAFRRFMEATRRALGPFRRIAKTTGGGLSTSTETGTVGSVSADLEYEKGTARGEFRFQDEGDTWRLLHLKITFDSTLLPVPARAALEPLGRDLLRLYDESAFVALYQRFSKPLMEAWKVDAYEPQVRDLRERTGKVAAATLRETRDEADGKVRTIFDVTFDAGPGEASFGWVSADADWHLVGFDLHLGRK